MGEGILVRGRGFIGSRQPTKTAAYFLRIYIVPLAAAYFDLIIFYSNDQKSSSGCNLLWLARVLLKKITETPAKVEDKACASPFDVIK